MLGLLWDFEDGIPIIVACFYSSSLAQEDWGEVIQPKKGGGRTTSVSIMNRKGVKKMYDSWICVSDSPTLIGFLDKHNKGEMLLSSA